MKKEDIKSNVVHRNIKSGDLGVLFLGYDYGCLSEDEVGIVYKGDDNNPNTPVFVGTNPKNLEKHTLKPNEILTEDHIKEVCKRGQGEDCCRYLTMSPEFSCVRINGDMGIAHTLDDRVRENNISAKAINCGGRYTF